MGSASRTDVVVDQLNAEYGLARDTEFKAATDAVVAGMELEDTGNQSYGSNVFVSTGPRFEPEHPVTVGRTIPVGHRESLSKGDLRCDRQDALAVVAVYDKTGARASRELTCPAGTDSAWDEGLFTWFGPVEMIGTPWSDNDPGQCQVVSVDRLRRFASEYDPDNTD